MLRSVEIEPIKQESLMGQMDVLLKVRDVGMAEAWWCESHVEKTLLSLFSLPGHSQSMVELDKVRQGW